MAKPYMKTVKNIIKSIHHGIEINMKKNIHYIALLLTIWGGIFISESHTKSQTDVVMMKLDSLQISIEKRTYLDSLYWEHLEQCAFINKDSVGITSQGYFYDKYHRKYKFSMK